MYVCNCNVINEEEIIDATHKLQLIEDASIGVTEVLQVLGEKELQCGICYANMKVTIAQAKSMYNPYRG
jgi:bacterioferritin-associated ferredoxin